MAGGVGHQDLPEAIAGGAATLYSWPDYRWIDFPIADATGFPLTVDGASTVVPGLYFCGVHFLRTRRSSLLCGVGDDAVVVAQFVATAE